VGKRTLVLRLGRARAVRWHLTMLAVAFATLPSWLRPAYL